MSEKNVTRRASGAETPGTPRGAEGTSELDGSASSTGAEYPLLQGPVNEQIESALALIADPTIPLTVKAPVYYALRKLKLEIERGVKPLTHELEAVMAAQAKPGERVRYGPLRLEWRSIDVKYNVNDPGNWVDDGVQSFLADWRDRLNRESGEDDPIIVAVPAHLEVVAKRLGQLMHEGAPRSKAFYGELKDRRLRTEAGKAASIGID